MEFLFQVTETVTRSNGILRLPTGSGASELIAAPAAATDIRSANNLRGRQELRLGEREGGAVQGRGPLWGGRARSIPLGVVLTIAR